MKKGVSRKFRSITSLVLLVLLLPFLCLPAAASKNPWMAKIRPGGMGATNSDSKSHSDFFIDLMLPVYGNNNFLFFLNTNSKASDENDYEQNLGLGMRGIINDQVILGVNAYYDYLRSQSDFDYHQWGVGAEILTKWVDVRGNYYEPFGTTHNFLPTDSPYWFGSSNVFYHEDVEEALKGWDAELGVLIPGISNYIETRVFGGGYWYDSEFLKDNDISGVRVRGEIRPADFLNINVEYRDDDFFGSNTYAGAYLDIPFSLEKLLTGKNPFEGTGEAYAFGKGARTLRERMTDKVVRDRDIVAPRIRNIDVVDPTIVSEIIYVDLENPNPGDGTLANPYQDINDVMTDPKYLAGKKGVWVFVFTPASADIPGGCGEPSIGCEEEQYVINDSLVLLEDWLLWGEGFEFLGLAGGRPNPIVDGDGNFAAVTLGENNTIQGMTIRNAEHGIYGENIYKTNIHDNLILDNTAETSGIHIQNTFAAADSSDRVHNYTIYNNRISRNDGYGIFIDNSIIGTADEVTNVDITTSIYNNTLRGNGSGQGEDAIFVLHRLTDNTDAMYSDLYGGDSYAGAVVPFIDDISINNNISGNLIESSPDTDNGISLSNIIESYDATASSDVAAVTSNVHILNTLDDNYITGMSGSGIYIGSNIISATAEFNDDSTNDSVYASVLDSSITNSLGGNTTSYNADSGILIGMNVLSAYAESTNSTVGNASTDRVSALVDPSSISNVFTENSSYGNDEAGIAVMANVASAYTNVSGIDLEGDALAAVQDVTVSTTATDNTTNANGAGGLAIYINELVAEVNVGSSSTIDGNVSATVDPSSITNSVSGHEAYGNYLGGYQNYLNIAGASVDINPDVTVTGDLTAGVDETDIDTVIEDSTFSENGAEGTFGPGVYIGSNLLIATATVDQAPATIEGNIDVHAAASSIETRVEGTEMSSNFALFAPGFFLGGNQVEVSADIDYSTIEGNVVASITDTTIDTSLINDTVNDNSNDGYGGVYIGSNLIGGEFDGDGNPWMVSLNNATVEGSVSATIDPSGITTEVSGSEISSNWGTGVYIGSNFGSAGVETQWSEVGTTGSEGIIASVTDFTNETTINDNTIVNNDGYGVFYTGGEIYAQLDASYTTVTGDIVTKVDPSGHAFTAERNLIAESTSTGLYISSNEVYSDNYFYYSTVEGNVTSEVLDGTIEYAINDNTVGAYFNELEELDLGANGGDGIYIGTNMILADSYSDYSQVDGVATTRVAGGISDAGALSGIYGEISGNLIDGNEWDGVHGDDNYVMAQNGLNYSVHNDNVNVDVNDSAIDFSISDNTVQDQGDDDGIDFDGNEVSAEAYAYYSYVDGTVHAGVDPSGINFDVTDNQFLGNDSTGMKIGDNDVNAYVSAYYAITEGGMDASVVDGYISNTFTGNTVAGNNIDEASFAAGLNVEDNDIYAGMYVYSSTVRGDASALVDGSDITNGFEGNFIGSFNAESGWYLANNGTGITIGDPDNSWANAGNRIEAYAEVYYSEIGDVDTATTYPSIDTEGSVLASVTNSNIENAFSDNTVSENGDAFDTCCNNTVEDFDGTGIYINSNKMDADAYVEASLIAGDVAALVDPSGISNTFDGDVVTDNWSDGIIIGNPYHESTDDQRSQQLYATAVVDSSIVVGVDRGGSDEGSVTANVQEGSIETTFDLVDVSNNNWQGADLTGIYIADAELYANSDVYWSSIVEGNVGAGVDDSTIETSLAGTSDQSSTVAWNNGDGYHVGFEDIFASAYAYYSSVGVLDSAAYPPPTALEGYEGNVTAWVNDSGVTNDVAYTQLGNNEGNGVYIEGASIVASSTAEHTDVAGDVSASVDPSGVTNRFLYNTIDNNYYDGVVIDYNLVGAYANLVNESYASGDVSSEVIDGTIANRFSYNEVFSNNEGDVTTGIEVRENVVEADTTLYNSSWATGDATSTVSGEASGIWNSFDNNEIYDNIGAGVLIGDGTGDLGNFVSAETTLDVSTLGYAAWGLYGWEIYNEAEAIASVENATISNSFTSNTIGETSLGEGDGNSAEGVYIENNEITANAALDPTFSGSSVAGDVEALVSGSGVENAFSGNYISSNYYDGVVIDDNSIAATASANSASTVIDSQSDEDIDALLASVASSGIENSFDGDTIVNNDWQGATPDTGVLINGNTIYSGAMASYASLYGNMSALNSDVGIDHNFASVDVSGNSGDGVHIDDSTVWSFAVAGEDVTVDGGGSILSETTDSHISANISGNTVDGYSAFDDNTGYGFYTGMNTISAYAVNDNNGNYYNSIDGDLASRVDNSNIYLGGDYWSADGNVDGGMFTGVNWITASSIAGGYSEFNGAFRGLDDIGTLTAEVLSSEIATSFEAEVSASNNTAGSGIELGTNMIWASALASTDDGGLTIDGDMDALVDGSAIRHEASNVTASDNAGDGIYTGPNEILATSLTSDDGDGDQLYLMGDMTSKVSDSEIENYYNIVTTNNNGSVASGVHVDMNAISAYTSTEGYNDGGLNDAIVGDMSSRVETSSINNTVQSSTSSDNVGSGYYMGTNMINAVNDIAPYTYDFYAESVDAAVYASSINNSFSDVEATDNGDTLASDSGFGIYMGSNLIYAQNDPDNMDNDIYVNDSMTALVEDSGIHNSVAGGYIGSNESDGVYVEGNTLQALNESYYQGNNVYLGGELTSTVRRGEIENSFSDNTITGNNYGDELVVSGVYIGSNFVNARAELYNDGASVETGDFGSRIEDSSIVNSFAGDEISSNFGTGVYVASNEFLAESYSDITWDGDILISGDQFAVVEDSLIANSFTNSETNDIEISNNLFGLGTGNGVEINNSYVNAIAVAAVGDSAWQYIDIDDDLRAEVRNTNIENTFANGSFDNNDNGGILINDDQIYTYARYDDGVSIYDDVFSNIYDSRIISNYMNISASSNDDASGIAQYGSLVTSMSSVGWHNDMLYADADALSGMTTNLMNNDLSGNDGSGVYIEYWTEIWGNDYSNHEMFMQGNSVLSNTGVGAYPVDNGIDSGNLTVDFGGGLLGSVGGNSFYDNGSVDVFNGTNGVFPAVFNDWDSAAGTQCPAASQLDQTNGNIYTGIACEPEL
jgi:hypothetical protein